MNITTLTTVSTTTVRLQAPPSAEELAAYTARQNRRMQFLLERRHGVSFESLAASAIKEKVSSARTACREQIQEVTLPLADKQAQANQIIDRHIQQVQAIDIAMVGHEQIHRIQQSGHELEIRIEAGQAAVEADKALLQSHQEHLAQAQARIARIHELQLKIGEDFRRHEEALQQQRQWQAAESARLQHIRQQMQPIQAELQGDKARQHEQQQAVLSLSRTLQASTEELEHRQQAERERSLVANRLQQELNEARQVQAEATQFLSL